MKLTIDNHEHKFSRPGAMYPLECELCGLLKSTIDAHEEKKASLKPTAEEWVKNQIAKNKETYKTPEAMIDEQIELLKKVRDSSDWMNEDKKWELITAVSEAYHVVIWVADEKRGQRLVNTIFSFVKDNVAV